MEYYRKCNVCGKITCYTDDDLKENSDQAHIASLYALSTIGNAIAGTKYDMYESSKSCDRASNKLMDYSKCPSCGSKDTALVTKKFAIFSNKVNGNYSIADLISEASGYLDKGDFNNAFCFATMVLNEDENNYDAYLIRLLASYEIKSLEEIDELGVDYSENFHFKKLLLVVDDNQKKKLLYNSNVNKFRVIYYNSTNLLAKEDSEDIIKELEYYIGELKNYNDDKSKILLNNLDNKRKKIVYGLGCKYLENNNKEDIPKALDIFDKLNDYNDSKSKFKQCKEIFDNNEKRHKIKIIKIMVCISVMIIFIISVPVIANYKYKEGRYNEADSLLNQEKYTEAFIIYNKLGDYKDSKKKAEDAENEMIYLKATYLYSEGSFEEAIAEFNKIYNYKDSAELKEKATLFNYIKGYNHDEMKKYINNHHKNYELIKDDEEIKRIFVNKWLVEHCDQGKNEIDVINFYPDGTGYNDTNIYYPRDLKWEVKDGYLYYTTCYSYELFGYGINDIYELRKVSDDVYLLFVCGSFVSGLGSYSPFVRYILIQPNSKISRQVGFTK